MSEESKYSTFFDACMSKDYRDESKNFHILGDNERGVIRFLKGHDENDLAIHVIQVSKELRGKGIVTNLVVQLIKSNKYKEIVFCGVQSETLERILSRQGFVCVGGDWVWRKIC